MQPFGDGLCVIPKPWAVMCPIFPTLVDVGVFGSMEYIDPLPRVRPSATRSPARAQVAVA
jgi:hypothetical protein